MLYVVRKEILTVRDIDQGAWRKFRAKTAEEGLFRLIYRSDAAVDIFNSSSYRFGSEKLPDSVTAILLSEDREIEQIP